MTASRLAYLNRLLVDYLGKTPAGGPLYKWVHSRDPELFAWIGRLGSDAVKAEYERVPQVWEQRWVLAMWVAPNSEPLWELQFQGQVPYPRGGYYVACSTPADHLLERGIDPNERITQYTIHLRRKQISLGFAGIQQSYAESRAYNKELKLREADALSTDIWIRNQKSAIVPGAREQLAN